jgi:predicted unusual protein kinase regulating ubiquinone biosynthesis (AarF/ABC1/UbiB family)
VTDQPDPPHARPDLPPLRPGREEAGWRLPQGRLGRSLPLASLTARTTGAATFAALWPGASTASSRGRAADRYAELLGRSRGALMKAGQWLSFTAVGPAMPEEHRAVGQAALARLQDSAPPMPGADAMAVAEAELGRPLGEVFAEFGRSPIAAASIGQVHAARLPGGRRVAVKVQYPGVAQAVRADLRNGALLATFLQLGSFFTSVRVDLPALASEIAERITEELDYRGEAARQAEFAAAYRGHPRIRVPEIIPDLCTSRLLTMDLADGQRWAQAVTAPESLRDQWGEVIVRFACRSLRDLGMINADPHPGNYLFHADGGVTFLDFGCVKRYRRGQVAMLEAAVQAAVDGRAQELGRALTEAGFVDPADPPELGGLLGWLRDALNPLIAPQPFRYTPQAAAALSQAQISPSGRHGDVIRRLTIPADYMPIARVSLGLTAVLGELRAAADWEAIRREGPREPPR